MTWRAGTGSASEADLTRTAPGARRRLVRCLGLGVAVALVTGAAVADAAPPELGARLACARRPDPGRVVCDVEVEVGAGVLAWADVLVLAAPPFAPPLRSRIGPSALHMKTEQRQRLQLALAATAPGSGTLRVRARAVVCSDRALRGCEPAWREVQARVEIGPITD